MVSEPDHAHSGPPNTDTEEEADPGGEPRRRSARTAAKVRIRFSCVDFRSTLTFPVQFLGFAGTDKAAGTQAKARERLTRMI